MKIEDITLDVCVSSFQDYQFDSGDTAKELILEVNRYKKYIRLYLLDKHLGYVSKKDTPSLLQIANRMRNIRVKEWSIKTQTEHYMIVQLHLQSYNNHKYYIYKLSFPTNDTYIGSTKNLPQRLRSHRKNLKKKTHINHLLQQAYNQCSNQMQISILFSGETNNQKIQFQKEQEFISKHKPSLNLINSYNPKGKIKCECGKPISYSGLKSHKKTRYHINKVVQNIVTNMVTKVMNELS